MRREKERERDENVKLTVHISTCVLSGMLRVPSYFTLNRLSIRIHYSIIKNQI